MVDTMEISGPWSTLDAIYAAATEAIAAVPGTMAVSAHQSHSYRTGGCLYFTFAAKVEPDRRDGYYTAAWDAGTRAVLANGGSLSHHHGVGRLKAVRLAAAMGPAWHAHLSQLKERWDPMGIMNPGVLGQGT